MPTLNDLKGTLGRISDDFDIIDMLCEFERTMDNVNLYVYKNWINGELVEGPEISRYWVKCTFMYPKSMMPDPDGALRLKKYGCKVTYKSDTFVHPVKILNRDDYQNQYTKQAKLKKHPVWLVSITMPRSFIDDSMDDMVNTSPKDVGVDTDDISMAYDNDMTVEDVGDGGSDTQNLGMNDVDMGLGGSEADNGIA